MYAKGTRATRSSLTIAHVLCSFDLGGAESVALELAGSQQENGHRVHAISLASGSDGPLLGAFAERGVSTRTIAKRPGFDARLPVKLAAFFAREHVDVVHVHNPQPLIYGAPAGRLVNAAVVYTKHGENQDSDRRLWLRRAAALCVDTYVAVSQATADVARNDHEVSARKLRVIENGIDTSTFAPDPSHRTTLRQELGLPLDAKVIGSVGRLSRPKTHDLLLRAAAPLLRATDGPHLLFVGDGPEQSNLRELADRLGVCGRVVFASQRRDVAPLLNAMDLFVLSSRSEGLPLVVLEAMATQLPVIASAVGGVPAAIEHGRTGLLVPSDDEHALRQAMQRVLSDEGLARALGRNARVRALDRFSASAMCHAHMALYMRILRRRARDQSLLPTRQPTKPVHVARSTVSCARR